MIVQIICHLIWFHAGHIFIIIKKGQFYSLYLCLNQFSSYMQIFNNQEHEIDVSWGMNKKNLRIEPFLALPEKMIKSNKKYIFTKNLPII